MYCNIMYNVLMSVIRGMANDLRRAWRLSAVRSLEVVRISEVKMYAVNAAIDRGHVVCPLYTGCPLLGVSIIGGSTVYIYFIALLSACQLHLTCTS